jgi:mono/diheme cytochrome c family protein
MTLHTPIESRDRGIPRWALGLTLVVFLAGSGYFATNLGGENPSIIGSPTPSTTAPNAQAIIKRAGCQGCHGPDLAGQATFPNLHGVKNGPTSANLKQLGIDHPTDWANIWITGTDPAVSDPALRRGMPVFGGAPYNFTPQEIATVVAYLKTLP